MAYNDTGPVHMPKEEDSGLTVKIGVPKWLKTMWETTAGRWFSDDDGYSFTLKAIAFLCLAPVAGGLVMAFHTIPVPAVLSVAALMITILAVVCIATVDDMPTAKQTFWRWMTSTAVVYIMGGIGIVEIITVHAMIS